MEKEYKVEAYGVTQICDACQKGEMQQTGNWKMTNPPHYEHACLLCGTKQDFSERYPTVRFRRLTAN